MNRKYLSLTASIAVFAILFPGCNETPSYQPPPPPKVSVEQPTIETIPIYLEENGQTESVDQAIIRTQVRGVLKKTLFEPDSEVTKGTPLFEIDREDYEAALESADAEIKSAEAALISAKAAVEVADAQIAASDAAVQVSKAEFGRIDSLLKDRAVSQSEWDSSKAEYESAVAAKQGSEAAKSVAQADVKNAEAAKAKADANRRKAKLDLDRTTVVAEIDGRVRRALVKNGNLVDVGTELVEIVKNDPIWANFNISEKFLLEMEKSTKQDQKLSDLKIKVELKRSGDDDYLFEGELDFADPKIDQQTGTMQLQAIFDNNDASKILLPGLFVRVRIQVGQIENAMLVPERAISRDQVGSFLYVVGDDQSAVRKNVVLGVRHKGMIVIKPGPRPEDEIKTDYRVIVDGIQRVRPGAKVDPN